MSARNNRWKWKGEKLAIFGECRKVEFLVEMPVDVIDHRMHAPVVFGLAAREAAKIAADYRPR